MRRSRRVSIIPYILSPNSENILELWFLFGVYNSNSSINKPVYISNKLSNTIKNTTIKTSCNTIEITDIGGGVKKDENDLVAALRELNEETHNIFENVMDIEKLSNCLATIQPEKPKKNQKIMKSLQEGGDGGRSVIFMPLNKEWLTTTNQLFKETQHKHNETETDTENEPELSSLLWLNETSFLKLLNINSIIEKDNEQYSLWSNLIYFYKEIYTAELRSKLYRNWIHEYYISSSDNLVHTLPKYYITRTLKNKQI